MADVWTADFRRWLTGGGCIYAGRHGWAYGQPFEVAISTEDVGPHEVELHGFIHEPALSLWRALSHALALGGVRWFWSTRMRKDGRAQRKRFRAQLARGWRSEPMERVNLKLKIEVELTDAATGDVVPVPFKGLMDFEYNGVKYADGLDIQASFAQAVSEHGARMIEKGRAKAAQVRQ